MTKELTAIEKDGEIVYNLIEVCEYFGLIKSVNGDLSIVTKKYKNILDTYSLKDKEIKEIKELINQIDNYLDKSLIYVRKKLVSLLSFDCDSKGANEYKNNILFTEEKIKRGNTNQELIDKISNQLTKEMNFAIPDLVKEAMKNINI